MYVHVGSVNHFCGRVAAYFSSHGWSQLETQDSGEESSFMHMSLPLSTRPSSGVMIPTLVSLESTAAHFKRQGWSLPVAWQAGEELKVRAVEAHS